jgi:hypothetical protein
MLMDQGKLIYLNILPVTNNGNRSKRANLYLSLEASGQPIPVVSHSFN